MQRPADIRRAAVGIEQGQVASAEAQRIEDSLFVGTRFVTLLFVIHEHCDALRHCFQDLEGESTQVLSLVHQQEIVQAIRTPE